MEKYIYDPTNGWWYELVGDYYIPCIHSEDPTTKPDCHTPESHTEVQPVGTRKHHTQSHPCRRNFASEPHTEEQPIGTRDNIPQDQIRKNSITPEAFSELLSEELPTATWSNRHLTYLRKHSPAAYREFLRSGTLHSYLAEIDWTAQAMYDRLIDQLANIHGITEDLKTQDQMEWVRSMNAIRHTAEEIVLTEVIYQ